MKKEFKMKRLRILIILGTRLRIKKSAFIYIFHLGELSLHNDSSERELKDTTSRKQDLMVEENILKLEIKRLRDQLHDRANDVLSLEERRLLLDTAMKERRQEVNIHNDMLKAQVKCSEEERQKIRYEIFFRGKSRHVSCCN